MKSSIIEKDHQALTKLCQAMTPEERLIAFLNHSRLIQRLYHTGKKQRRSPGVKTTPRYHR